MQRNSGSYEEDRKKAEQLFEESKAWIDFRYSRYSAHYPSKVKPAIDLLNQIPENNQTDQDLATLLKYNLAAGFIKVEDSHMNDYNFDTALPFRKNAVDIQRKILVKNETSQAYVQLAQTLYYLAMAYSKKTSPSPNPTQKMR